LKYLAIFNFTHNTTGGFINIASPAAGTFIFFSQIRHANAAVHPAWSNK
jgi:hypothetical protein